ncbi:MAG TPA: pseudouridine synthase [Solirubrobacteraceae bacterium]|nr:pseudouridine synthase [Solirubrobacteraceae bacterium]
MRLAKYLAHAGIASRRAAEELIREGRVTLDGRPVTDPALDVTEDDALACDGRPVGGPEARVVYAVHKPAGVVSTARDTHGRPTVTQLIADPPGRLYPVGRLDADTTGLLLLTNDGELAHRLTHPSFEVPRVYVARVSGGPVSDRALHALREGVWIEDAMTAPARVRRLGPDRLALTIHEGRNRQVRRMCESVGHPVVELTRVAFGPLRLGALASGQYRQLDGQEVQALRRATVGDGLA